MKSGSLAVALGLAVLLCASCSDDTPSEAAANVSPSTPMIPSYSWSPRSGDQDAPEGVFLPRLTGSPPNYGAAAIEGTLVEDGACLELTKLYFSAEFASPSPGSVVLVLWPEGSKASRTDDGRLRVEGPGLPSTVTGERLFVGGAFTSSRADAEQMVDEPIPADCRVGLYWVATPVHS